MMSRAEIIHRLHEMVDHLAVVPESWFEEGWLPMNKTTFVSKDGAKRLTLVVGLTNEDEE